MNDIQVEEWNLGTRKFWASPLNVSLKYYDDVFAGRQIVQKKKLFS